MTFLTTVSNFIANHQLGCAFIAAAFIGALPKPGQPWTMYEIFYNFVNTVAVNLPQKGRTSATPTSVATVSVTPVAPVVTVEEHDATK